MLNNQVKRVIGLLNFLGLITTARIHISILYISCRILLPLLLTIIEPYALEFGVLIPILTWTKKFTISYFCRTVRLWNSLLVHVFLSSPNIGSFQRNVKKYLCRLTVQWRLTMDSRSHDDHHCFQIVLCLTLDNAVTMPGYHKIKNFSIWVC